MVAKNDSAMEITSEEFRELINNSHKLVVIDFYADWCMPCLMLAPVIEDIAEYDSMKEVKFAKINIDENPGLAQRHNITSIPCLVIFKDGKEVDRIIGNQIAEAIERKILEHL